MKRKFRINEKALKKIIKESVKRVLRENNENFPPGTNGVDNDGFYFVPNPTEYCRLNGLKTTTMYKVGQIKARPSVQGRENQGTVLGGGFAERGKYTENGNSMIVRNPKGEEYQVPMEEFNRKYLRIL